MLATLGSNTNASLDQDLKYLRKFTTYLKEYSISTTYNKISLFLNVFTSFLSAMLVLLFQFCVSLLLICFFVTRPKVYPLCNDWSIIVGWIMGCLYVISKQPLTLSKIENLRFQSCFVVDNSVIAFFDIFF